MTSKSKDFRLPSSRIKTIMKSSPEVENVSQDSLAVVTKATELFIQDLAKQALNIGKPNKVDYCDLAEVVQNEESLFFLKEIIPRKITVREYKELMKKEGISDEISSSSEGTDVDSDVEVLEDESSEEENEISEEEDEDEDDKEEDNEEEEDEEDDDAQEENGEEVQR